MKRTLSLLLIPFVLLTACATPQQDPTPTPLPSTPTVEEEPSDIISGVPTLEPTLATLQLAVYPPQARTGLTDIDPIIDAVLRHDFPGIRELTRYLEIGCVTQEGLGGPPACLEGENEGTMLQVVPILGPEGHHLRRSEYESWEGLDALGLLAAYRTASGTFSDPAYPAGDFGLVFLLASGLETVTLQVSEGKIVRYDYRFEGLSPVDLEALAAEIILPLNFQPIPTPIAWKKLTDPQGRFSLIYPPSLELTQADGQESWQMGDQIKVEVLPFDNSWITCFDQSLGDCPFVETDDTLLVNGHQARRITGYFGAVGGYVPQEFQTYLFSLGDQALVITVYALPIGMESTDIDQIWPLQGIYLEFFQRTVETVLITQ